MSAPINRVVRVFIASSDELTPERKEFDTLFAHLNTIFEARGISLKTEKWEFLDSSAGPLHKQEEYNRVLKTCDICVVVFWQKFGDYTKAELDVAYNELCAGRKPTKLYIYFKEPGDMSAEMQTFKESFDKEYSYGHFYGKFSTLDKLQLDFVLQLERFLHSNLIKVEDSQVKVDQLVVAHLDNIPFAADNERYRELREKLSKLEGEIVSLEAVCQTMPNPALEAMLNDKKQERYTLREELEKHEQLLLGAAVRVAQYTGERISERMKRAIELFNEGKVSEANAVLDEAERDADQILNGVRELKAVGKQSVDELLVKASYMLADEQYTIEERIEKTHSIYQKALELATECNYEEEKLYELLSDYCYFLIKYAKYDEAQDVAIRCVELSERLYGENHLDIAASYRMIGLVYDYKGDYDKALEHYFKSLAIREKVLGVEHSSTAQSYNNIGSVYDDKGNYNTALEYYNKALAIRQQVFGENHLDTAASYNNIGNVYANKGDYDAALENYEKALTIQRQVLGENHPDTATLYNNIGGVYDDKGDYHKALEYHNKALDIRKQVLGENHPDTATSYNNIGNVYHHKGDYDTALENYEKSLTIQRQVLGENHPDTATSYNNIGGVCDKKGDYDTALDNYNKALDIRKQVLDENHPDTATSYNNIGVVYHHKGDYDAALDNYNKALDIRMQVLGENHPDTATSYNNIGAVYDDKGDYDTALENYNKAKVILEQKLPNTHPYILTIKRNISKCEYMNVINDKQ